MVKWEEGHLEKRNGGGPYGLFVDERPKFLGDHDRHFPRGHRMRHLTRTRSRNECIGGGNNMETLTTVCQIYMGPGSVFCLIGKSNSSALVFSLIESSVNVRQHAAIT